MPHAGSQPGPPAPDLDREEPGRGESAGQASEEVPLIADNHQIVLRRSTIVRVLWIVASFLLVTSIAGQIAAYLTGHSTLYGMIRLFDIEQENNIPSFFSASLLLLASLLLAVIAVMKRRSPAPYTLQWAILAFTFLYLAVDEAASIHELLMRPARELLGERASGILYFPWVIPGMAATLVFALSFLPFVLHLPLSTRVLVLLAAPLFVGGAIGMELIGGRYADLYGRDLKYNVIATLEEGLEMAGAIVFIYAMLTYIERYYGQVRFRFA